jgi:hypothetical protein
MAMTRWVAVKSIVICNGLFIKTFHAIDSSLPYVITQNTAGGRMKNHLLLLPTVASLCFGLYSTAYADDLVPETNALNTESVSAATEQNANAEKLRLLSEKRRINQEKMKLLDEQQKLNTEEMNLKGLEAPVNTVSPAETSSITPAQKHGVHMHDGFFLRLAPGIGSMSASEEVGSNKLEVSGVGGLFNFAIGGAITENFIIHFDASSVSVKDPTIKVNGTSVSTKDTTVSTTLIGGGFTYYFPSNAYMTAAVGQSEAKVKSNGTEETSDKGFGVNIMLGKEWWVSDNWGLGIAGQFLYTSCPVNAGSNTKVDYNTTSFGVLFSATYN